MGRSSPHRRLALWAGAALLAVGSCVTPKEEKAAPKGPSLTAAEVAKRLPRRVKDKTGWAKDILAALDAAEVEPTVERVCAVVAVIEQESGFQADPAVAELPRIVREGLAAKLKPLGPLAEPTLAALLSRKAPGSEVTFAKRIDRLRTERDLDRLFRDIAAAYREALPGGFVLGSLQGFNPVTTAGSMQVKVTFARTLPELDDLSDAALRELLYTRAGGVRAGAARLLGYAAGYDDMAFRFADYNAGVLASRNAAFQAMLSELTGQPLALDGDLLAYDDDGDVKGGESKTLTAMLAFGRTHDLSDWAVERAARKEKSEEFEETSIWESVRSTWEAKTGRKAAYARMPDVAIVSPKMPSKRTTAWFAQRVARRYDACRGRDR